MGLCICDIIPQLFTDVGVQGHIFIIGIVINIYFPADATAILAFIGDTFEVVIIVGGVGFHISFFLTTILQYTYIVTAGSVGR